MNTTSTMHARIKDLPISSVERYLQQKGWARMPQTNPKAIIYTGPQDIYGKPITVVLPARKTLIDANKRLNEVVQSLALLEAKRPEYVIRDMSTLAKPTLRAKTRDAK